MGVLKRAYLQNQRKWGKTILMFLLLLIMSTLILTCFSIQSATKTAALNVRQSLKGAFTVDAKATNGQLSKKIISKILKLYDVQNSYNGRSNSYAEFRSTDGTPLKIRTEGAYEVVDGFEHAGKLMSNVSSEKDSLFTESGFKLIEGEPIIEGNENVALVHQSFVEKNGLSIGDCFLLTLNNKMFEQDSSITSNNEKASTVKVRIIGVFTNTEPQESTMLLSHVFYENTVFTDPLSYSQLFYGSNEILYDYADFDVIDPANLNNIINKVKEIDNVDWNRCIFTKHDTEYENAKEALNSLSKMMMILVAIIIMVSSFLLILILALWVKSRIHETGIFLAIGYSKWNILMQHILELMLVAICSFTVAYFASTVIAQGVGERLLNQASTPEYKTTKLLKDKATSSVKESNVQFTKLEVLVTGRNFLLVDIVGTIIILVSVTCSSLPILRMKPKEILTKMS